MVNTNIDVAMQLPKGPEGFGLVFEGERESEVRTDMPGDNCGLW